MTRLEAFVQAAQQRVQEGFYDLHGEPLANNGLLSRALRGGIIAELKARSPSEGPLLRHGRGHMLASYAAGGADAISVLTDADHFDGDLTDVRRANATGLPVLWKDFVVHAQQMKCAAHHGASAVLLIERILEPVVRDELIQQAHTLGLEVLLEVHDAGDWHSACTSKADLIGVNARDLETLQVDRAASLELLAEIRKTHPVIALSGIRNRGDRMRALDAGACGVLVGTLLMRQAYPDLMLKALRRPLVKVCGIMDVAGLEAARGADLVGFVLTPSPRQASIEGVPHLMAMARALGMLPVAVTRGLDGQFVAEAAKLGAAFVQGKAPSGLESPIPILAALEPGQTAPDCDAFVIDTPSPLGGGSGEPHNWSLSAKSVASGPHKISFIAGGLDGDNVAAALQGSGASGADASSRLESSPGQKDASKVKAFIDHARRAHD